MVLNAKKYCDVSKNLDQGLVIKILDLGSHDGVVWWKG